MSNLLVQNIKHTNNTSAQTIDTSGRTTAVLNNDTTYRSEGGAKTENIAQSSVKAWIQVTTNSTNQDSFNISSHADTAAGRQTISITNGFRATTTMSGAACASEVDSSSGSGNSNRYAFWIRGTTNQETYLNTGQCNDGALVDVGVSSGVMCGDLL